MKFNNLELGLSVVVNDNLIQEMHLKGLAHYPKEYGGILVGYYAEDRMSVTITDIILPLKYKSSEVNFERGSEGLEKELLVLFNENPSKIYVGEWHTHPNATTHPSRTDMQALQQIVASKSVNIHNPVMLIMGLSKTGMELGFYVYAYKKIYKYDMV